MGERDPRAVAAEIALGPPERHPRWWRDATDEVGAWVLFPPDDMTISEAALRVAEYMVEYASFSPVEHEVYIEVEGIRVNVAAAGCTAEQIIENHRVRLEAHRNRQEGQRR